MIQPYQEKITDLAQKIDDKVKEFTAMKDEVNKKQDGEIIEDLLIMAQQCVEIMDKGLVSFKDEFQKISQEAKDKIDSKPSSGSGSGMRHK